MFSHAKVFFSVGGKYYPEKRMNEFKYNTDRIFENARDVTMKLHGSGRYVKLQLFFAMKWMMISEINFESGEYIKNMQHIKIFYTGVG